MYLSIVEILTTALCSIQITQGQRVRSFLHVRPKQGELCFTMSDVGLISHSDIPVT